MAGRRAVERGCVSRVHPGSCHDVFERSKVHSFKVDCVRAFIGHTSAHHRLDECTAEAFFYVRADGRRPPRSVDQVECRARRAAANLERRGACRLELDAVVPGLGARVVAPHISCEHVDRLQIGSTLRSTIISDKSL